jgi:Endodeoxyribonuclease RusA
LSLAFAEPIGHSVGMTGDSLERLLDPLHGIPDVTSAEVLATVIEAYKMDNGTDFDESHLDDADREKLHSYLVEARMAGKPTLFCKKPVLSHLPLYESTAAKVNWFQQHPCPICLPGGEVHPVAFPVGVPPWSHQCAPQVGRALRSAIDASPTFRETFKERVAQGPVCVRMVFVLGDAATMKDCDNMAKGMLDAFQGLLYANDKQVEHLDLIKFHSTPGTPGYILVRRTSTSINAHRDIVAPHHARLAWMSAEDLNVDQFLTRP